MIQCQNSYRKDDEFAFENGQEVARLLPHHHPDLDRGSIVFVINVERLVGARRDLIVGGVAALRCKT